MTQKRLRMAFLSVSGLTALSRCLGLCRDVVCANVFGASASFDAFLVAFQLPNFMRRLFAEGAFSQSFVPIYSAVTADTQWTPAQRQQFINNVMGLMFVALAVLTCLAWCFAPWLIRLYAPGFYLDTVGHRFDLAVQLLRWTFPYILFVSMTAGMTAVLNSHGRFVMGAWLPVLLNICLVTGAILSSVCFDAHIMIMAQAVLVAGVLQCILIFGYARHKGHVFGMGLNWRQPLVRRFIKLLGYGLLGAVVGQLGLIMDTLLASLLPQGAISWLYYGQRLVYLPVGMFAVAMSTVIMPRLSMANVQSDRAAFERALAWSVRMVWCLALPATLGLMLLSSPIVMVCFHHGSFSAHSLQMTQWALVALACGLPAFMLNKVLMAAMYARQCMQEAVHIGLRGCAVNVVISVILMPFLQHVGIALATALAAWYQCFCYRQQLCAYWSKDAIGMRSALFATAIMSVLLYVCCPSTAVWQQASTGMAILWLLGAVVMGVWVYEMALRCLKASLLATFMQASKMDCS